MRSLLVVLVAVALAGAGFAAGARCGAVWHSKNAFVSCEEQQDAYTLAFIADGLTAFRRDQGRYPSTEEGLRLLTSAAPPPGTPYAWPIFTCSSDVFLTARCNEIIYRHPGRVYPQAFDLVAPVLKGGGSLIFDVTRWEVRRMSEAEAQLPQGGVVPRRRPGPPHQPREMND
jgi:hypothetical protein